jgi:hypothetical protein
MNAVIEITHYGANVTYVREATVTPWLAGPISRPESCQHMRDPGIVQSRSGELTSGRLRREVGQDLQKPASGAAARGAVWLGSRIKIRTTSIHRSKCTLCPCAGSQLSVNLVTSFHQR